MFLPLLHKLYAWIKRPNDTGEVVVTIKRASPETPEPDRRSKKARLSHTRENMSQRNSLAKLKQSKLVGGSTNNDKWPTVVNNMKSPLKTSNNIIILDDDDDEDDVKFVSIDNPGGMQQMASTSRSAATSATHRTSKYKRNANTKNEPVLIDLSGDGDASLENDVVCVNPPLSGKNKVFTQRRSQMKNNWTNTTSSQSDEVICLDVDDFTVNETSRNTNCSSGSGNVSVNSELKQPFKNILTLNECIRLQDRELYKNLLIQSANMDNKLSTILSSSPESLNDTKLQSLILNSSSANNSLEENVTSFNYHQQASSNCGTPKKIYIEVEKPKIPPIASTSSSKYEYCQNCKKKKHTTTPAINNVDKYNSSDVLVEVLKKYDERRQKDEMEINQLEKSFEKSRQKYNEELVARLEQQLNLRELRIDEDKKYKLPEITKDMWEEVVQIMKGKQDSDVLVQTSESTIRLADIRTLDGLRWLNDEVINTYLKLIKDRSSQPGYPTVHCFNTFFYKRMKCGYAGVRRWTKKVDIFSKQLIIVPVHLDIHWCVACINLEKKRISYYDSMGTPNKECTECLLNYLREEHCDKKKASFNSDGWKLVNLEDDIPQQLNGSDCGVFSCMIAEHITRNSPLLFTQENMPYFRKKMIYEILTQKLIT